MSLSPHPELAEIIKMSGIENADLIAAEIMSDSPDKTNITRYFLAVSPIANDPWFDFTCNMLSTAHAWLRGEQISVDGMYDEACWSGVQRWVVQTAANPHPDGSHREVGEDNLDFVGQEDINQILGTTKIPAGLDMSADFVDTLRRLALEGDCPQSDWVETQWYAISFPEGSAPDLPNVPMLPFRLIVMWTLMAMGAATGLFAAVLHGGNNPLALPVYMIVGLAMTGVPFIIGARFRRAI